MKLCLPRYPDHYPDLGIDCQEAADAAFREVWENFRIAMICSSLNRLRFMF